MKRLPSLLLLVKYYIHYQVVLKELLATSSTARSSDAVNRAHKILDTAVRLNNRPPLLKGYSIHDEAMGHAASAINVPLP